MHLNNKTNYQADANVCLVSFNAEKPVYKGHPQKDRKLFFKNNYGLMQVKSTAERSAILLTFINLPFVIKIFVLSIFEWPFYTGFTVAQSCQDKRLSYIQGKIG